MRSLLASDAAEEETTHINPGHPSPVTDYATWLNQLPQRSLTTIHVPQEACSISTPLCSTMW